MLTHELSTNTSEWSICRTTHDIFFPFPGCTELLKMWFGKNLGLCLAWGQTAITRLQTGVLQGLHSKEKIWVNLIFFFPWSSRNSDDAAFRWLLNFLILWFRHLSHHHSYTNLSLLSKYIQNTNASI